MEESRYALSFSPEASADAARAHALDRARLAAARGVRNETVVHSAGRSERSARDTIAERDRTSPRRVDSRDRRERAKTTPLFGAPTAARSLVELQHVDLRNTTGYRFGKHSSLANFDRVRRRRVSRLERTIERARTTRRRGPSGSSQNTLDRDQIGETLWKRDRDTSQERHTTRERDTPLWRRARSTRCTEASLSRRRALDSFFISRRGECGWGAPGENHAKELRCRARVRNERDSVATGLCRDGIVVASQARVGVGLHRVLPRLRDRAVVHARRAVHVVPCATERDLFFCHVFLKQGQERNQLFLRPQRRGGVENAATRLTWCPAAAGCGPPTCGFRSAWISICHQSLSLSLSLASVARGLSSRVRLGAARTRLGARVPRDLAHEREQRRAVGGGLRAVRTPEPLGGEATLARSP